MADRKAQNKYYPPEWDPSKGSINKFRKSHPLRDRARMLDQGILIIRFEMPYNIWCTGCENHIGMGVRYNAQKTKIGMYHTTPVMQFRMKCHLCDNYIVMKTDPANLDYEIVSGARRQERRWDQAENGQIEVDKSLKLRMMNDPMFMLEHQHNDKKKSQNAVVSITELTQNRDSLWSDDYSTNCDLRNKFRGEKKDLTKIAISDIEVLKKNSLPVTMALVEENEKDVKLAKVMGLKAKSIKEEERSGSVKRRIINSSIFGKSSLMNCSIGVKKSKAESDTPISLVPNKSLSNSHSSTSTSLSSIASASRPTSRMTSSAVRLINYDESDDSDT